MEGSTAKALLERGRSINRKKGKYSNRRSKSRGKLNSRSTSPTQLMRRFWNVERFDTTKETISLKDSGPVKILQKYSRSKVN